MNFKDKLLLYSENINQYLRSYMDSIEDIDSLLLESMKYSLLSGGKRIRPIIFLVFNEIFGGKNDVSSYKVSCSIEMIHTYSLIHDDLPSMDNDDMRRGKPSNHIVYGENIAILAGDALLTQAFENISSINQIDCEKRVKMMGVLSRASGSSGMISGQSLDIHKLKNDISDEEIINIYKKKTGMLFSASCQMGAILAGADKSKIELSGKIGEDIGILFQIVDDILDVVGQSEIIGKNIFSDINNSKCTFISKNGIELGKKYVDSLSLEIKNHIKETECTDKFLDELLDYLKTRVN